MRPRAGVLLLIAAAVLAVGAGLRARNDPVRPKAPPPRAAPAASGRGASTGGAEASPGPAFAAPDLERLRDVFRYADEPARDVGPRPRLLPVVPDALEAPSPAPGPRLVGVLRRGGRLVAALASEGEVELAASGESAAGVLVLSVGEDGVRVRLADGSERFLQPPE